VGETEETLLQQISFARDVLRQPAALRMAEYLRDSTREVFDIMKVAPLAVFSLALCCFTLPWLACTPGNAAPQNISSARPPIESATMPLDGGKIFSNYCASCHGVNGNGDGPVAPALKTKVPDLTTLARRNRGTFPATRVRGIIAGDERYAAHGSREMPVWGPIFHQIEYDRDLGYVRLQNVTEYLGSIQKK
jgi:mono/diheme cytochrome c family protein